MILVRLVDASRRHAIAVLLIALGLAGLSFWAAHQRLGVSTDTDKLFRTSLPWRQRAIAYGQAFPQFGNLLVAVIDAQIPEQADATAAALATALRADPTHFRNVSQPGVSGYFTRNAFLFLDQKDLSTLLDSTVDAQPFLGQLAADPSARGLFAALSLLGVGVLHGQQSALAGFSTPLLGFHTTLSAAADGHAQPLSWQQLLAGSLVSKAGRYRFVLCQPVLDYGALQPGGRATATLRAIAKSLPTIRSGAAHIRLTGSTPLTDEEFATVAEGIVWGTLASVALITLWLFLAVGSWRLIVPILLTLLLGLALTTGFAALAVGTLNLVSVAFAILFVGIAVDFAIQFCVRYREALGEEGRSGALPPNPHWGQGTPDPMTGSLRPQPESLAEKSWGLGSPDPSGVQGQSPWPSSLATTARRAGGQIAVAAGATAAGFYAFVPTSFNGVAELGLIAGTGMILAFLCTLGFLPACLTLFAASSARAELGFAVGNRVERGLHAARWPVLATFLALALAGAVLLPRLVFDSDPLHTKNRHTEAMQVLSDLMGDPITNPYSADIIAPSLAAAQSIATRLSAQPLVSGAITLQSFVPTDQPAKLALIADANSILSATLAPRGPSAPVTAAQLRLAIASARAQIDPALPRLTPTDPLSLIAADLARLATASDDRLLAMNDALTRFLPEQLNTLRTALHATPVALADIPPDIARDWLLPDGRARIHVLPKPEARDSAGLHRFVRQVQSIAPDAGGAAVTIVSTAATIVGAFRGAAIGALIAIAALLALFLRRPLDVALVMAPLLLSALMTVVVLVAFDIPLNFANIIALPLLLGVGVSFNIYFVMNWRAGMTRFLGSATARAVIFSALTTGTAFGSLALSHHPGTASMGVLLLISLACTLIATLAFIPTLLGTLPRKAP